MKTPHSKGSRYQFPVRLEVKELSFSQPRGESRHLLHSRGGNVSSGTGLRAVRRGWRLPCPRTSRRRRPAAMPSTTRGRVTVRPRPRRILPLRVFHPSVKREAHASQSADSSPLLPFSPGVPADAVLPLRRARHVRGAMGRDMGVHGQEQEVRPGLDRRRRNISTTESLFERARADTPIVFSPPQGRPGAEFEGAGARAGGSGAGEAVLDPDGPQGGGAAVAETVRRQGAGSRGGVQAFWDVTTRNSQK
jgi:hypothetical protein